MITAASLVAAGIPAAQAQRFEAALQATFARFAIDTPTRMAAFVAQCAHESRNFTALEEGLFYRSADRIRAIFSSRVPNAAAAQALVGNPQALANRVYAGRNGNGDEASGDGFRYRGRGLIQLTGRANYERAAGALARDYVADPDLVAGAEDACLTAGWFWDAGKLNALADAGRFDAITRAINGPAMAGAQERRDLFEAALAALSPAAPAAATRGAPAKPRTAAKKTAAKKPAAKKPVAKKATAKKTATKKSPAGKSTGRKATAKKTTAKTASPKRAARKTAGKAAASKKTPRKKAAGKKRVARTVAPKRRPAPAKRAASKRRAPKAVKA